jgi:V/A-type H+-transporting ATPase subunit I
MPKYSEVDPTPLLGPFYWVFFGMMVGDLGYGLLTVAVTSIALKVMSLKEGMKDFMRFFRYLGISTSIAGILYGSFFGMSVFRPIADPAAEGGYRAIIDTQYSILTMLILSVVIGVIHIIFGLCIKTYLGLRDGKPMDAFSDGIIWIITLLSVIGWLLAGVGFLPVPLLGTICQWVFIASLVGIFLTQGRASPSIGGKIGNGLYGVYGLTSYVGDIVSYTRIMALALAGAYIAYAFNIMTGLVVGEFGDGGILMSIIRLFFGALITVFGQTLNFGLSLLGAYVHTARLQYVEYFGKFYEGGGVVFAPLALKNESVRIKK